MAERSKSLRIRRNSVTSDVVEIPDKHAAIVTPTKRRKNISNDCGVNKSDDQTSFSKRLTRAGSEAKSLPTITRPTRRTRASSMEPETIKKSNVIEITNSGLAYNSVTIRTQRSPLHPAIIEGREETMTSIVALDHVLPNLNETNKTYSDNSTIEESNKSMSISKDTFNSSFENRCKEGVEADVYAKKEHANPAEHPAAKALQENETGMSINKNTFSDISEKSRSDSTDTITQMKTSIPDVPNTQSRISTEVTPRKLRLKNESSTNNSIKEEDEHFSNKENQASNIIEDTQNKDLPVSNILSQSPQPLLVSDVCTEKSVKENDENTVIFTDTESLSKTSLNDSMDRRISCIDTCDDSDENLRILKCPANVNNINLLSPLNNDEDQNALSVEIRDDSNQDGGIQIEKYEENINDTHTDECSGFDKNKKEQIQHITSEDETIAKDENVGMRLILEADETANIDKEDRKEVCLTEIATANVKCEGNNQAGVSITPENLNDTGVMEYSKLPDTSVEKISTSLIISTDETATNDLQETEVAAKVPSHQSISKEPFDVQTQSNNFELANENENNITNVSENSHSSNVTQSLVESIDEALKNVDVTQNTSKVDNCPASEEKSIIDSNSPNDVEKNETAETVRKQEENMQVDDNISDAHIDTDLFQDIPADEWKERNSDKNSVHSMSTERLENEGENECDDFVLVDKEISQTAENINIEKEKESFDYDSDDTVLLKAQQNALKEKTVERMDMSESQCKANENKFAEVKDTQEKESMQQEEIIAAEAKSENEKEHVENQTEEIQNAENVSMRTSVSKESPPESDTSIEKPTLTNEINQTLDTESALNKRKCKGKLSEDMSNERKSVCKTVEKSDGEVEEPSEVDTVEEKDSLSKSPIGSPTNVSGSSITYESIDSDIEREYNLNGVEVCQFSDDDVPGDECRASETESSDPDDNGSDLADFVVNDDDEISEEEVESSEFDEESYNGHDDKHRESDTYAMDEQREKIQMQDESYEKRMNNGKQKKIDRGISKKEKSKFKRSVKLSLDKITESGKKMTNSKIGTIDKKRKRNKTKRWVEDDEIDEKELAEQCRKVQIHEEIAKKVTKKGQCSKEENVERIQNNCTGIPKKEKSKLRKTTKLDLSEMSESGKNVKRKSEIGTGNKMKKIKAGDNDSTMQKENAIPTWRKYENSAVKSNKMELWRKRVRNLLEEVISRPSGFTMHKSKKRKLNTEDLPSRSILHSIMKKSDINVKQDFTSLSLYGSTTNFYVTNIQKLKKRKNALEMQLHRHRMLNRKARLLNYIMFLEKR